MHKQVMRNSASAMNLLEKLGEIETTPRLLGTSVSLWRRRHVILEGNFLLPKIHSSLSSLFTSW